MRTKKIIVRTSFKGMHCWPEASTVCGEQVKFLESEHRHTFYVQAELSVNDSDREVEFFVFQKMVDNTIRSLFLYNCEDLAIHLGRKSCETMAEEIINALRKTLNNKLIAVEVWEDNEVGARVEDTKEEVNGWYHQYKE